MPTIRLRCVPCGLLLGPGPPDVEVPAYCPYGAAQGEVCLWAVQMWDALPDEPSDAYWAPSTLQRSV